MVAIHWHQPRGRASRHHAVLALGDAGTTSSGACREWRRRSRERAELAALDDRMLKDIGLTRADAEFLEQQAVLEGVMTLLAIAGSTIGAWWRRAILALTQPAPRSKNDVPPEFYKFPIF